MTDRNENLDELLGQFFDGEDVSAVKDDLLAGEKFLENNPAPDVDEDVVAGINRQIGRELSRADQYGRLSVLRKIAVVALIVIVGMVGLRQFGNDQGQITYEPSSAVAQIWEEDSENSQLAMISAEMDDIAESILAVRLGEGSDENDALDDIEFEVNQSNGDFWKG